MLAKAMPLICLVAGGAGAMDGAGVPTPVRSGPLCAGPVTDAEPCVEQRTTVPK